MDGKKGGEEKLKVPIKINTTTIDHSQGKGGGIGGMFSTYE